MTFSIAARCDSSGQFGAAIASATPCVGTFCLWMQSGIGVACTQSWTNPYLAIDALARLASGSTAAQALTFAVSKDGNAGQRQIGVVASTGEGSAWTGSECTDEFAHITGPGYSIQGNMLGSVQVIQAMEDAFTGSTQDLFEQRLLLAIKAGQQAGGDKRGQQSAALATIARHPWRRLDLRVDDHSEPLVELERLLQLASRQFLPFADALPDSEGNNAVDIDNVKAMMLNEPDGRG